MRLPRRALYALPALLLTPAASAKPMPQKCLPFAPSECRLSADSPLEDYLACFDLHPVREETVEADACREELLHARVHLACDAEDIPRYCGKVKPGSNRVMNCLRRSSPKLSPACRSALENYDGRPFVLRKSKKAGGKTQQEKKRGASAIATPRC